MFHQQHGVVFFQLMKQCDHGFSLGRAHAGQRLVQQQHLRFGGQHHGDFQLALYAVAQVGRDDLLFLRQTGKLQSALGAVTHGFVR